MGDKVDFISSVRFFKVKRLIICGLVTGSNFYISNHGAFTAVKLWQVTLLHQQMAKSHK